MRMCRSLEGKISLQDVMEDKNRVTEDNRNWNEKYRRG
jgi:hypothetical protein